MFECHVIGRAGRRLNRKCEIEIPALFDLQPAIFGDAFSPFGDT
jgi:hypothetical protein